MGDKVKKAAAGVWQRWKSISRKLKVLLGCGVLALVVALVVIMVVVSNRPYTTLFADLSQTDMSGILTYLSENGVTQYKVEGDTILVPEDQEALLKAQVLQAGYPSSGYGYDTYFDNVGSLTTEAERNQLVLYALQDRMQAVIRNFDGVKEAVDESGFLGLFQGGFRAGAVGTSAALIFSYLASLIFRPKMKK